MVPVKNIILLVRQSRQSDYWFPWLKKHITPKKGTNIKHQITQKQFQLKQQFNRMKSSHPGDVQLLLQSEASATAPWGSQGSRANRVDLQCTIETVIKLRIYNCSESNTIGLALKIARIMLINNGKRFCFQAWFQKGEFYILQYCVPTAIRSWRHFEGFRRS